MGIVDLKNGKKKVIKLKEDEICTQGFRIDLNGKIARGVPHKNQNDCHRFCYADT
jgi:ATP phosphoribosyltransferase regulatory subunit HisZ